MSYALVVAEVRRGLFEERNLDSLGLSRLLGKEITLLMPDGAYTVGENVSHTIIRVRTEETTFLNPLVMVQIVRKVIEAKGAPGAILFTSSSSGIELASYLAGALDLPLITDVSGFDAERGVFLKSYYSDKIFGEFKPKEGAFVLTVRSGSCKEHAAPQGSAAVVEVLDGIIPPEGRSFVEYVEEEKGEIDITKADFLLSVGRGIGSKDEIPGYEELADILRAVLSGSRPVIDKMWLPKPRQVGTSGKTVRPKVYLAMAISGAFQHIAGMKDSDCIIAVNKDPEAPIFQYAHFGVICDANKLRDKMKDIVKKG
jgi:electron transfer flavoprotein alpha subunit